MHTPYTINKPEESNRNAKKVPTVASGRKIMNKYMHFLFICESAATEVMRETQSSSRMVRSCPQLTEMMMVLITILIYTGHRHGRVICAYTRFA